jgi:hypothetical protein
MEIRVMGRPSPLPLTVPSSLRMTMTGIWRKE